MSEQGLSDFIQSVQELFAVPVRSVPVISGNLFPPDQAPALLVYFGEASADDVQAVRGQLPAESVLLWIAPPGHAEWMVSLDEASRMKGERTLHLVAETEEHVEEKLALLIARLPRRTVRLVIHQSFQGRYPEISVRLAQCIKRTLANLSMDAGRGLIFLRASLLNLGNMATCSVAELPLVPLGTVALVCAAGPSLKGQLEEVRAFRKVGLLVAVGHAVRTLHEAGIQPHVVVEDDALAGINWPPEISMGEALLVAATTVDTRVARRFDSIFWCQGSSPTFNEYLSGSGIGQARMTLYKTVSAHAVEAALRMGCMQIAMVGQDFSLGPSGMLHAEGDRRVSGAEHLLEVPANEGGTVYATKDLAVLREALEEYLEIIERAFSQAPEMPRVVNCTAGGALIRGAERMSLSAFMTALQFPASVSRWNLEKRDGTHCAEVARVMLEEAEELVRLTGRVLEVVRRVTMELEKEVPDIALLDSGKEALQQLLSSEREWWARHEESVWLTPLLRHVERISSETPGLISDAEEPAGQLHYLERYYQMLRDLSEDVRDDLRAATSQTKSCYAVSSRDSAVFPAFKKLGVACIRGSNPGLADWLAAQEALPLTERFRFRWKNQMIPGMEVRAQGGGDFVSVAGEWSMIEDAREEANGFFADSEFDPARFGLVVIAPCNWIHALEMLSCYPTMRLLVVEPWLDALCEQMLHGCFLHRLPHDAVVIGADERLPGWKARYREVLSAWKTRGITPCFFTPKRVAHFEELRVLHTEL